MKEVKGLLQKYTKIETNKFGPSTGETVVALLVAASQHFDFLLHYDSKVETRFAIPPTVSVWEIIGYINYFYHFAFISMRMGESTVGPAKLEMIKEALRVSSVMPRQVIQGIISICHKAAMSTFVGQDSETMTKLMISDI